MPDYDPFLSYSYARADDTRSDGALPVHPTIAEFLPTILSELEPLG